MITKEEMRQSMSRWIVAMIVAIILCFLVGSTNAKAEDLKGLGEEEAKYARNFMKSKFASARNTNTDPNANLRNFFAEDGEFVGRTVYITYTDEHTGQVKTEPYVTKFPRFKRDFKATFIEGSAVLPGAGILDIPTVGLAFEHWWMSFELLMKAQREYAECVAKIDENLRIKGYPASVYLSNPLNPSNPLMLIIKEYWVPSFAPDWLAGSRPASRLDYLAHFQAGILSVNQAVFHVGLCEQTLDGVRQLPNFR